MKRLLALGACLIGVLGAAPAGAQTATTDASLYQAFGEKPGLTTLSADFVRRLRADPRIGEFFKDTNLKELQTQLTDQLCVVSGGPCVYEGAKMAKAHADMKIRKADFNALVEVLQDAMDAQGIPFGDQTRLLARLAPMHRDVVNQH